MRRDLPAGLLRGHALVSNLRPGAAGGSGAASRIRPARAGEKRGYADRTRPPAPRLPHRGSGLRARRRAPGAGPQGDRSRRSLPRAARDRGHGLRRRMPLRRPGLLHVRPALRRSLGAFARSRAREIEISDFALVHCNSHADGYWTDITRTWCISPVGERQCRMFEAVFAARQAALDAIRPGVRAADVDAAARGVMRARGFGAEFKHSTGHGVGFASTDHQAPPRIAAGSAERLEAGMVFNIEPAAYVDGFGGVRHCDMVAVTETGAELLTPFQCRIEELTR